MTGPKGGTAGLALLILIPLSQCGGGPKSAPRTFYSSAAQIPVSGPAVPGADGYDQALKTLMVKWNVPGLTLAVVHNGRLVVTRGYGYADYENKQAMRPDSRLRIASASKTLTAAAILHLVKEGKLSFQDRFLDILTQFDLPAGADQRLRTITIRNLLQHSGGWDRDRSGDPMGVSPQIVAALRVPAPATCSNTIQYMLGKPLDFNPGEKFVYSNFGYCILGRVVEKLSGQRYEQYVRDVVLAPMDIRGMATARTQASWRGPNEVKYYDYSGAPLYKSVYPNDGTVEGPYGTFSLEAADASGAWVSSSIDLTRFLTALDGTRGSYFGAAMLTEFTAKPQLVVPDAHPSWNGWPRTDAWYGMGIFLQPDTEGLTWWHWGNMAGSDAVMLRNGRGYTWAVLVNTMPKDVGNFMLELDQLLWTAFNAGVPDAPADLYPQFPSLNVPAAGVPN